MSIRIHNKNVTRSLSPRRDKMGVNRSHQEKQPDENEICKEFLSKVVDEVCEALIQNNHDQDMHLPMWLMEYYNQTIKLYSMDHTEVNALTEDRVIHYMEISVNIYHDIIARLDKKTGQKIFLKVRNQLLRHYNNKTTHPLIFLMGSTYKNQKKNENK